MSAIIIGAVNFNVGRKYVKADNNKHDAKSGNLTKEPEASTNKLNMHMGVMNGRW
jgi:hypothetical protein